MRKLKPCEIDCLFTMCDLTGYQEQKLVLIEHLCDCELENRENPHGAVLKAQHHEDSVASEESLL